MNTLITLSIIILFYYFADWGNQYLILFNLNNSISNTLSYVNEPIAIIIVYILISFVFAALWYIWGKAIAPISIQFVIKFLGGLTSKPFIDKDVNKNKISWVKFLIFYYNLAISLFAIDFLLANSIFYKQDVLPSFLSTIVALAFISTLEPIYLVYDSVGIRSYNDRNSEIFSVSAIMGKMTFRLIQTGGLLAIIASISLNNDIIDSVPISIRIIFVRTVLISTLTLYFFVTFFQSEAIFKDWKRKSIPGGKTIVKLDS